MTKESRLLEKLEARAAAARAKRASTPELEPAFVIDSVWADREWHLRMIRHLSRRWDLQVLVDQAAGGYTCLEAMPDDELAQLHSDLHRAYECMREGTSLEDAGFLRGP